MSRKTHPKPDTKDPLGAGLASHEGKVRRQNEDSVVIVDLDDVPGKGEVRLYVVADGAGGMAAGKLASDLTVNAVKRSISGAAADALPDDMGTIHSESYTEWLQVAVRAANYLVHLRARRAEKRMASTLVVALVESDVVHIANVGDSRAYIVDEFGMRQITRDHSAAQELVSAGIIRDDEVKGHPFEHVLTRAIGPEEDVEPDLFTEQLLPGDRLLLCSDGLTNMVGEEKIWEIVSQASTPQMAAQRLIDEANKAGGKDNITALVVENP